MSKRKVPGISSLIDTNIESVHVIVKKKKTDSQHESDNHEGEGPFSCTTDDDYLDDARYKSVVLHKLANIRKLLQRAVSIHDKPSVPNNVAIGKRHFKTEPISHVDTTVVVREISEMGVMNFMPCTALQEIFDLEQSMRVDSQIYEDVVTYIRVRRPVEDNQLPSALRMICSDEVLYQFNWSGLNGRKRISDLVIFSKIIFEEWYKDRMTLADYINELKEALNKVHKRTHKKRTRWQRKKEEEGEYAD